MTQFAIQWWLATLFGVVVSILTMVLKSENKKIKAYKKEQLSIKLGIQALLRGKIQDMYIYYMDKGYVPIYAREVLEELAKQYYNLEGNGVIHELMDKLSELPTEK